MPGAAVWFHEHAPQRILFSLVPTTSIVILLITGVARTTLLTPQPCSLCINCLSDAVQNAMIHDASFEAAGGVESQERVSTMSFMDWVSIS